MPTNPYFDQAQTLGVGEKNLIQELTDEMIQITGMNVFYIPRVAVQPDKIFGEDILASFETAYEIEAYLSEINMFGDIMAKTGWEVNDTMTLVVSTERFKTETGRNRPSEGDLFYFPLSKDVYEIAFVETEEVFYQAGKLYSFKIQLRQFEYSHEHMDTGIDEVDRLAVLVGVDSQGEPVVEQPADDAEEIEEEAENWIEFDPNAPFGQP